MLPILVELRIAALIEWNTTHCSKHVADAVEGMTRSSWERCRQCLNKSTDVDGGSYDRRCRHCRQVKQLLRSQITIQFFEDVAKSDHESLRWKWCARLCRLKQRPFTEMTSGLTSDIGRNFRCDGSRSDFFNNGVMNVVLSCIGNTPVDNNLMKSLLKIKYPEVWWNWIETEWWNLSLCFYHSIIMLDENVYDSVSFLFFRIFRTVTGTSSSASLWNVYECLTTAPHRKF